MNRKIVAFAFAAALFLGANAKVYALFMDSPSLGYAVDLPDDCFMSGGNGLNRYQFSSRLLPVELLLCVYQKSEYKSAAEVLGSMAKQLSGGGETESFEWRNRDCAVSQLTLGFNRQERNFGWAAAAALPYENGYVAMLGFYPESAKEPTICEAYIVSAIDSLCTDRGALFESGIFTSFVYPKTEDADVTVTIAGKEITAPFDKTDAEANQYLIEREYFILFMENNNGFGEDACRRFYRMVYRDSGKRLKRFSFMVKCMLSTGENAITDRLELAQALLTWTQGFEYARDPQGTDFTSLPAMVAGQASDCDSRALLLAVMLYQMDYKTAFFVSDVYSHAMVGLEIDAQGARIPAGGTSYLLGETTAAKVAFGQIAQDMSNINAWTAVLFPNQQ